MNRFLKLEKEIAKHRKRIDEIDKQLMKRYSEKLVNERNALQVKIYTCKRKYKNYQQNRPANGYSDDFGINLKTLIS